MDRSRDELAAPPLGVEQPAHAHGVPAETFVFSICACELSLTRPACDESPAPPLGVEQLVSHGGGKAMRLSPPSASMKALSRIYIFARWRAMTQRQPHGKLRVR
jgi:hypothetical protein